MEIRILVGDINRFNLSDFENEVESNAFTFDRLQEILSAIIIKKDNEKLTNVFNMDPLLGIYSLSEFVDAMNKVEIPEACCWTTWFYLKQ